MSKRQDHEADKMMSNDELGVPEVEIIQTNDSAGDNLIINPVKMKRCCECKEEKEITSGFHKNKGTLDGYTSKCKKCMVAYQKRLQGERFLGIPKKKKNADKVMMIKFLERQREFLLKELERVDEMIKLYK